METKILDVSLVLKLLPTLKHVINVNSQKQFHRTMNETESEALASSFFSFSFVGAGVQTKHATYQIVLPIIYLYCFKGMCGWVYPCYYINLCPRKPYIPVLSHTHTHARTHARTHTHTHIFFAFSHKTFSDVM